MPYAYSNLYLKGKKYELSEQAKQLLVSINNAEYSKKNERELYSDIVDSLDTTNGIDILLQYNFQSKIPEYGDQWNYTIEQDTKVVRLSLNPQTGYVDAASAYSSNWKTEKITNEWGSYYTYPEYNTWLSTKSGSGVPEINTRSGKVTDTLTGATTNNTKAENTLNSVGISLFGRTGYTYATLERTITNDSTGNLYATSTYLGGSNGNIHYPDLSITTESPLGGIRKVTLEKSQNVHDIAIDSRGNIYIVYDKVVLPANWDPSQPGAWEQVTNKANISVIGNNGIITTSEFPGSRQQLGNSLDSPIYYDYYFSKDNSGNVYINEVKQPEPASTGTDWYLTTTKWSAQDYVYKGVSAAPTIATFRADTSIISTINTSQDSGNTFGLEGRGEYNAFIFAYTDSPSVAEIIQSLMNSYIGNLKLTYEYPLETAPTYSLTPTATSLNEGGTLTTTVATTNVASGTTLYYALSGTGINVADFSSGSLSGQVTTGTNGSATFSHTLANDLTTEGTETLQIKLFSDSARTIQVGSTASVTISDTSTTPAPTYSLTPSSASINEGSTLTTTVATSNVASGTTLYYALSGTGISAADFSAGALTGQVTTGTNGTASFSHTLASDLTTEGAETLQIKLFSDSSRTIQVGETASLTISDASTTPAPTYSLTPSVTSINEGSTLTTSIATTNVASGTTLYYALSGTGISTADFSTGALTGQVTTGTNGSATFSHTLASDLTTEGAETLQIKLFSDSARTIQVGDTASVTIVDTSTTPAPTYSLTPSVTSINEGSTLTTTVATNNVASGTNLYYALSGTGISAADFSSGALTGQVTTGTNGSASFSHTLANDLTTEGTETLQIKLFSDSARTIQVGSTASVTISDTSTTPAPTYSLTPSSASINEGSTLTTTVATTNVASGTTLYYALSGTGISAADFSSGALTGQVTTGTNGSASFSHTLANDRTAEGTETLQIKLFSDSSRNTQVGSTVSVTINDTSSPPVQTVYTASSHLSYTPGSTVSLPLLYNTSTADTNLTGLTLNVHYNSSLLTPSGANNGVSGLLSASIATTTLIPDTNNTDNDPLTDKIVQLLWASFDTKFPGTALPATLGTLSFSTSTAKTDTLTGQPLSTSIRYTAASTTVGYDFLSGSTTLKAQSFNLDVDGDGLVTPLGDGLMVIRKLFGSAFAGDALCNKAISPTATRSCSQIHDYIQQAIDSGMLDIDKDGKTTPLGDGLMVIRYLFGSAFAGNALTNKAISPDSPYFSNSNAPSIVAANIDALKPTTTTPVI